MGTPAANAGAQQQTCQQPLHLFTDGTDRQIPNHNRERALHTAQAAPTSTKARSVSSE